MLNPQWPTGAVVITGASTGIGAACALYLDKLGFTVFAGVRQVADGARLQAAASPRLKPLIIDLTDQAAIDAAAATVSAATGSAGLAGLVNNAGFVLPGPLEFLPIVELRKLFEVNVIGQVAVTQAFLPLLRQGQGRIINMGSVNGVLSTPFNGPYSASKFALEALSDSLRAELQPWQIQVSLIQPGSIDTPIWIKTQRYGRALWAEAPAQAKLYYEAALDAFEAAGLKMAARGLPPEVVAEVVAEALTAPIPKTRYLIGQDAVIEKLLARLVPDRLRDRLLRRELNQPGAAAEPLISPSPRLLLTLAAVGLALVALLSRRRRAGR